MQLRRHLFSVKGLQGCGVDTMAAEGTQFQVCVERWLMVVCHGVCVPQCYSA